MQSSAYIERILSQILDLRQDISILTDKMLLIGEGLAEAEQRLTEYTASLDQDLAERNSCLRLTADDLGVGPSADPTLLTIPDLARIFGVTRQTVWRLRASDDFPKPVKLHRSARSVRYRRNDVEHWLSQQQASL